MIKGRLDTLLNVLAEACLDELGNFLTEDTMAVADRKEVSPSVLSQVRQDKVRILVHFVWVLWAVASFCRERKFRHTVVELLLARLVIVLLSLRQRLGSRHFPSD